MPEIQEQIRKFLSYKRRLKILSIIIKNIDKRKVYMRTLFALAAVLAATVCATPLAPLANQSASAGTLAQIDAHSLEAAAPLTDGAADDLWMGQIEADLDALAEDGAK